MIRIGMIRLCMIYVVLVVVGCKSEDSDFVVPDTKVIVSPVVDSVNFISNSAFSDLGNININVPANANSWDMFDLSLIKNISGAQYSYCHPDVEYFENGFNGFKFWMAFTPYFGAIGASGDAILYENPTIVASNDGLNWSEPSSIVNPIQKRPSFKDGIVRNVADTLQGYWSDTDLLFTDNRLELFYRGSVISPVSLKRTCETSLNNSVKLLSPAVRTVVKQISSNGKVWSPLEVLYTSNFPETLNNNDVLSPSFIKTTNEMVSYEVLFNNGNEGYTENDNSFILKRTSTNGLDFSNFANSKIVHLINKPWKNSNSEYSPWHLQATYVDGYYFLYLAVGRAKSFTSEDLYLAYSKDGNNFKVHPEAIVKGGSYRSCLFPMLVDSNAIQFGSVVGLKSGKFKYRKFKVNKFTLKKMLS